MLLVSRTRHSPSLRSCAGIFVLITAWLAWPAAASNPEKGGAGSGIGNLRSGELDQGTELGRRAQDAMVAPLEFVIDKQSIEQWCIDRPAGQFSMRCVDNRTGGVDHVVAGVGLRNAGQGHIQVLGAPAGAELAAAFLYVGLVVTEPTESLSVKLDGITVSGELVASTIGPCWTETGIFATYRFDVVDLMRATVNGFYSLTGVPSAKVNGEDPFVDPEEVPDLPLSEGASLVVFYTHDSVPSGSRGYLHDGAWELREHLTVEHALTPPPGVIGSIRHTRIAGDGQRREGDVPVAGTVTFLGAPDGPEVMVRGPGSELDRSSDFTGSDGGPIMQLWDSESQVIPGEQVDFLNGADVYTVRYEPEETDEGGGGCQPMPIGGGGPGEVILSSSRPFDAATGSAAPRAGTTEPLVDCVVVVAHVMTVR